MPIPTPTLIVFDLDGTLVDSAPQIALAVNAALRLAGLDGAVSASDIGPPLDAILQASQVRLGANLAQLHGPLARAKELFFEAYDGSCHLCPDFEGADACLRELFALGFPLALATNKRRAPALSILRHRGWLPLFSAGIHGLEDFPVPGSKGSSLLALAASHPGARLAMVGDTVGDLRAAAQARYDLFAHAEWGAAEPLATPEPSFTALARTASFAALATVLSVLDQSSGR